jgi:hypothetical protein
VGKSCLSGGLNGLQLAANAARTVNVAEKVWSKEKQALEAMARLDKRKGVTKQDLEAYKELNRQLPDPFRERLVRGPEKHLGGAPHSREWHGHVGPVDHIPIR